MNDCPGRKHGLVVALRSRWVVAPPRQPTPASGDLELDRVLRMHLEIRLVRVRRLELLELLCEAGVIVVAVRLRDGLLVLVDDDREAVVADDDRDLGVGRIGAARFSLPFLLHLEPRQLRPHRCNEQERDHAGQQIDVGHQKQLGVDVLPTTAPTSVDRETHVNLRRDDRRTGCVRDAVSTAPSRSRIAREWARVSVMSKDSEVRPRVPRKLLSVANPLVPRPIRNDHGWRRGFCARARREEGAWP
jgi:hypothetical protein